MKRSFVVSLVLNLVLLSALGLSLWQFGGLSYLRAKYVEYVVDSPYAPAGSPYHQSTYYQAFQTQFDRLPVDSSSILFAGDSHVERGRWEEYLQAPVRNRGISGEAAQDLLWRAERLTRGHPAQIILLTGANDAARWGRPADEILATYDQILERLRAKSPSTVLTVLTIPKFGTGLPQSGPVNRIIGAVNAGLPALAARHGATLVDAAAALAGPDGAPLHLDYTIDHLHLNGAGYAAVAAQLRSHLVETSSAPVAAPALPPTR